MTRFQIPLIALLCLSPACAAAKRAPNRSECVTHCGLVAPDDRCGELQLAEIRFLAALDVSVPGWTLAVTCPQLDGWHLVEHQRTAEDAQVCPAGGFALWGICFAGYTRVDRSTVELDRFDWSANVLPHELVHVVQVGLTSSREVGHCGWTERGITRAIRLATGYDRPTPDEPCGQVEPRGAFR